MSDTRFEKVDQGIMARMSPADAEAYAAAIQGRHADAPPFDAPAWLDQNRDAIVAETQSLLTAEQDPGDMATIIRCRQRAVMTVLARCQGEAGGDVAAGDVEAASVAAVENASGTISATPARDADCITADFQI